MLASSDTGVHVLGGAPEHIVDQLEEGFLAGTDAVISTFPRCLEGLQVCDTQV